MTRTVQEIISDEEVARVHANAKFGSMTPRDVLAEGVWKYSIGYTTGYTMMTILREHGLITKPHGYRASLTEKGKEYARACAVDASAEITRLRAELAEAREVKELVWEWFGSFLSAETPLGITYNTGVFGPSITLYHSGDGAEITEHPNIQAAKDAAQADYAARILAALKGGE